jgi:hypothetical protein
MLGVSILSFLCERGLGNRPFLVLLLDRHTRIRIRKAFYHVEDRDSITEAEDKVEDNRVDQHGDKRRLAAHEDLRTYRRQSQENTGGQENKEKSGSEKHFYLDGRIVRVLTAIIGKDPSFNELTTILSKIR